ncbi:MAG: sporulation protein [Pirellulaceae bacterium]|nr:sporulation protein [Pirellulaceae bacterium]
MAKCDLSIELDDPKRMHPGGGNITGVVRVDVDKNVTTKGLEVSTGWKTHGRGNVASGQFETITLFTGEWRAGEQFEYRFDLPVGHWPPSYHGDYLNVDHYVNARAKIPWGFDPKAAQSFLMRPTGGPDADLKQKNSIQLSPAVGCALLAVFMTIFFGILVTIIMTAGAPPFLLIFIGFAPLIGGLYFFFKVLLPKYLLGDVQCNLEPLQVTPGESLTGELVVRPRKNVTVNGIKVTLYGAERVVSGSGSNRTTHTKAFLERDQVFHADTTLQAGQEHRIPLDVQVPGDAPPSLDLPSNELIWKAKLRIDIPRWPDWTKEFAIAVVPSGQEMPSDSGAALQAPGAARAPAAAASDSRDSGITFAETAQHFWGLRDDEQAVNELADAVSGLSFDIEAFVERRLLYSGEEDPHVFKDGYAIWAHFTDPPLPLVLYVPHDLADEFEQIGRDLWRGQGTIVGWDSQHRRLQVKLG